jgi:hypothetical protein
MSQYRFNANRLKELASRVSVVAASIHDYKPVSANLAKVIVTLSSAQCTGKEVAAAITRSLGGNAAPVLGSFRVIPGARCTALAGFVVKQPEVVFEDDPRFKNMRPVTASIMLDPGDSSMWDVRAGADGKTMLVRAGDEDLTSLLQTASVRDTQAPRMQELASCSTAGEFVAFVDPAAGELRHGFVLASDGDQLEVLPDDGEEPVVVPENVVVEAAMLHGREIEVAESVGINASNFDSRSKASMTEFYKQLYGYAPAYVEEIQKQIDAHAAV